ncbi:MAG: hypothetical protein ACI8X5_002755 [Planctomycetota bacterium]|jgi:hypothetical protein
MKKPLACLLLILGSCSSIPFPTHEPQANEDSRAYLHQAVLRNQFGSRLVERAVLRIRGEDVVLTIYADGSTPGEWMLAAVSDMGATVFSVHWKEGEMDVQASSPIFSGNFLEQFIADQISALMSPSLEDVTLVQLEDGQSALYYELYDCQVLVSFGEDQGVLHLSRGEDGALYSTIELRGSADVSPLVIRASDHSYSGTFEITPW